MDSEIFDWQLIKSPATTHSALDMQFRSKPTCQFQRALVAVRVEQALILGGIGSKCEFISSTAIPLTLEMFGMCR